MTLRTGEGRVENEGIRFSLGALRKRRGLRREGQWERREEVELGKVKYRKKFGKEVKRMGGKNIPENKENSCRRCIVLWI